MDWQGPLLPVFLARSPRARALLPYLEILDDTQQYSNRGVLVCRLEEALSAMLCGPGCRVVTAACGTAALQAAILSVAGRASAARPLALVPGYTFVATAMAAEACGYEVVFCDVDPESWCATPEIMSAHPDLPRCGVVVPVAPYGRAISQAEWAAFRARTGIAVVIDAAAGFEALCRDPVGTTGSVPVALSFQATKSFSTGEGGGVVWSDHDGLMRVAQALNFGFLQSRSSRSAGFNGKMSEYHAAVGLAALERWAERTLTCQAVVAAFHRAVETAGVVGRIITAPMIASNYALFAARSDDEANAVAEALGACNIAHRFWYGRGVQCEPYFADRGAASLPGVEQVAKRLLGIPMFEDLGLDPGAVGRIVGCIATASAAIAQA